MSRASKICSWRDPENESIGCSAIAVESPSGENFRCERHWRKSWAGQSAKNRRVPALTESQKAYIRERDWHVCAECGEPARQVDHIVEVADGGTNVPSNLQLLCDSCHSKKTRHSQDDARRRNSSDRTSPRARLKQRRRMMGLYEP